MSASMLHAAIFWDVTPYSDTDVSEDNSTASQDGITRPEPPSPRKPQMCQAYLCYNLL